MIYLMFSFACRTFYLSSGHAFGRFTGFAVFFLLMAVFQPVQACEDNVPLRGDWYYNTVDQASNATAMVSDPGWTKVTTGESDGVVTRAEDGIRWYRLEFDLDPVHHSRACGLFLGRIQEVDEVYLNGQLIGGSGRMSTHWFDYVSAYLSTRGYAIPTEQLREQDNVLAVRVLSFYLDSNMPFDEVFIGPEREVLALANRQNLGVIYIEVVVVTIHLLGAMLIAVTALSRSGANSHRWLAFMLLILAAAYANESLLLYEFRMDNAWLKRMTFVLMAMVPPVYLKFHYALFGGYPHWSEWALAYAPIPLALLHQFNLPIHFVATTYDLWHMSFLPFGIMVLYKLFRSSLAGIPDARLTLIAMLAPIAGFGLAVLDLNVLPGEIDPIEAGAILMTLLLQINFARGYAREHQAMMHLSKGVLEAQDEERRRIARELHDGLGQRMVATRLMLDALHMGNPNSQLEEPVKELREAVTDLRAMVYGLRPASLEDHDLVTALKTYAARTTELTGTLVEVEAEEMRFDLPTELEEHVFRIFQEAINNAIRHGLASRVNVVFDIAFGHLTMEIKDNGDGFKVQEKEGSGVGLTAMAERARVCEGRLQITSKPNAGTVVWAEIPIA